MQLWCLKVNVENNRLLWSHCCICACFVSKTKSRNDTVNQVNLSWNSREKNSEIAYNTGTQFNAIFLIYIIIHDDLEIVYLSNEKKYIWNICTIKLKLTLTVCPSEVTYAITMYSMNVYATRAAVVARIISTANRWDWFCIQNKHIYITFLHA